MTKKENISSIQTTHSSVTVARQKQEGRIMKQKWNEQVNRMMA